MTYIPTLQTRLSLINRAVAATAALEQVIVHQLTTPTHYDDATAELAILADYLDNGQWDDFATQVDTVEGMVPTGNSSK